ncbi:hypothetical protein [Microbacterium trichothecenolyticum]|uniref:Uncharacterized protein n=1 Tax=Microbacterium trichothecenolyticum TaxID=69370 RepID=A0ABU0TRD5_MICTR|nr:hypothetical protein [Microbacterium trichothecenolyticum]MDQ1122230.1 hypothetical protein [Microbacterium trichothecenolyticum]
MAVIVAVVYLIVTSGILSLIFDSDVESGGGERPTAHASSGEIRLSV